MNMMFMTKKALRKFVQKALDNSETPMEFEKWLSDNTDRLYVQGDEEPYTASELAELV